MIPVILMIGFVPLIVHTYKYRTGLSQFDWFPNSSETQVDVFFAWKMITAILIGTAMLIILLVRHFNKKERFRFDNAFYLLFFYALFVAMSALFSPYKYWVLGGTYELFESVWTVFAYIILCYYTYNYVCEVKHVATVIRWAGVGMLIVSFIGAFQYAGSDFFKTSFGKHLITGPQYWNNLDAISFVMAEGTSYTTLYNPNFLSFYFGMLIPLTVCLFIASKEIVHRILTVMVFILAVMCMFGSHSDSGWLALTIAGSIVVLILLSRTKKTRLVAAGIVVLGFAAVGVLYTRTPLGARLSTTFAGTYRMEDRFSLRSIEANSEYAALDIRGNKILLSYVINETDGQAVLRCTDENGTELSRTCIDETNLIDQLDDPLYYGCLVQPTLLDEMLGIRVQLEGATWDFAYIPNNGYYYANSAGKLTRPAPVKSAALFREDTMSGRGHIWNCTIPLLGKRIFVGVGANAYMLAYPQDDYIYHAHVSGANNYDVKAHCWYLQQWVENGLIGLLLLVGFLGWYIVHCARIYRKANLRESITWVGIGLFTAVLVYIIAAVANDSNVCTAPVFWGFLGLGMAVNRMIEQQQRLFVSTESGAEVAIEIAPVEASKPAEIVKETDKPLSAPVKNKDYSASEKENVSTAGSGNISIAEKGNIPTTGKSSGKKKTGKKKVRGKH